jgi:hypothetical protein
MRQTATKTLRGDRRRKIRRICDFLGKHLQHMHYDQYLAAGYPIATGVIEGACRHVVRDRMERAGMRWVVAGAQAMLDLRTTYLNGQWEDYQTYRITRIRDSDHGSFWHVGCPALMITDTANFRYPFYHTPDDNIDKIDFDRLARVVRGLEKVVAELAEGAGETRASPSGEP